jgi:hypothetical protein
MEHLPVYLWVMTYAEVAAIAGAAVYVLYGGARSAGLGTRRATGIAVGAVLVFGGWLAVSSVIGGHGGYRFRVGHGVPWLPVAVIVYIGALIAVSRRPLVARALSAPGALNRLMLPHSFRIAGIVFVVAMLLGKLPALFALPAGVGDIAVGDATPWVTRKIRDGSATRAVVWFNLFGMADLVSALTLGALTGFRFVSVNPPATLNSALPLVLIPTVGVPLLVALHVTSLTLLRRQAVTEPSHELQAEAQVA